MGQRRRERSRSRCYDRSRQPRRDASSRPRPPRAGGNCKVVASLAAARTIPAMDPTRSIDLGDVTLSTLTWGEGPLVLCAHGFPDGPRSFREQVEPLVAAGFQVASPAMRGYWPSSEAISRRYDPVSLARDLIGIADELSPREPVRLVGHDWGAVAAYAATALAPERFSHVVTLSVPHARTLSKRALDAQQARRSWYMGMFQLPFIAERRLAKDDLALVDRLWRDWSPGYSIDPAEMARIKEGIRPRIKAVIGYYRAAFSVRAFVGDSRKLLFSKTRVPALYLHGEDDGCIGVKTTIGMEADFSAGVEIHRIAGAGHFLHLERPDVINPLLLSFLRSERAPL